MQDYICPFLVGIGAGIAQSVEAEAPSAIVGALSQNAILPAIAVPGLPAQGRVIWHYARGDRRGAGKPHREDIPFNAIVLKIVIFSCIISCLSGWLTGFQHYIEAILNLAAGEQGNGAPKILPGIVALEGLVLERVNQGLSIGRGVKVVGVGAIGA